jgi:hypothetical protein
MEMEMIQMKKKEVEKKLRLGMKLKRECMRLLGKLVNRLEVRVRWVNLVVEVEIASSKLLELLMWREWSRTGGGRVVVR